ncbi:MAG: hypothetical protein NVSMB62_03830 [Acidobacteriaceae bacterium]
MQWESDLIGYDAMSSYDSPSYYAQVMFAEYLGTSVPVYTVTGLIVDSSTRRSPMPLNTAAVPEAGKWIV